MESALLVQKISESTFAEIIQASPRHLRHFLFTKARVHSINRSARLQFELRQKERMKAAYEWMQSARTPQELEVCQELIRNWLYTKKAMLKATLDFLGIENHNGLVDRELDFFPTLSEEKVHMLVQHLHTTFPLESILIYLHFVGVPFLEEVQRDLSPAPDA